MRLFIDSADLEEIKAACLTGAVSGVTTNPSLIAKTGKVYEEVLLNICQVVDGPVSAEVLSETTEEMVREAYRYTEIHSNINIKIPVTREGLAAIHQLKQKNIMTNATLVFSANQALMAARAGASYVSPFIGRMDDIGGDGYRLLQEVVDIFSYHQIPTQIIAASIRSSQQVIEFARIGSHIATIPPAIFEQMIQHPLTTAGIARFFRDWEEANKK